MNTFHPAGNGTYEYQGEEADLAIEIKARPHPGVPERFAHELIGLDLYVEGFGVDWCDNKHQVAGWKMGNVGEGDTLAAIAAAERRMW